MDSLRNDVGTIGRHIVDLEKQRFSDPFANDVYEAAWYCRNLGKWVLENNTKVNFPARGREELAFMEDLRKVLLKKTPEEQARYAPVFEIAEKILRVVKTAQPPKDGHLGILRVVREQFSFLQANYGFAIVKEEPLGIRFSSGAVYLELEHAKDPALSCSFGPESNPKECFWIDDLLFMHGDDRYRTLPQELALDTEGDVEKWFKFLAGVFKQYGHEVLTNRPGIFDQLTKAQAQRDQEYTQEADRLYGKR